MAGKFRDSELKSLKPKEKDYLVFDGDGLYVRVLRSGEKTFYFHYNFATKKIRLKIGKYPTDFSLSKAREKAGEYRTMLSNNINPKEHLEAEKLKREREASVLKKAAEKENKSKTLQDLTADYMEYYSKPNKRSWKEDQRIIDKIVLPGLGKDRKVKDISRDDIRTIQKQIGNGSEKRPIASNRTFALLRKLFNYAVEDGLLERSPCEGLKPLYKEESKDRFLTQEEVKKFWHELDNCMMTDGTRQALKLILVTGQRPGEVVSIHRDEVDGNWWTIPSSKTKNKKDHRVFLTELALSLLGEFDNSGYFFSSDKRNGHLDRNALSRAIRRNQESGKPLSKIENFSAHDLRRTAATHLARIGHALIVGKILNHTDRSITTVYDRHGYDAEKERALKSWSSELGRIIADQRNTQVIPFKPVSNNEK